MLVYHKTRTVNLVVKPAQDHTKREPIPEKRSSWLATTLFFVNTILIIVYGCVENTEVLINIGFALLGVVRTGTFFSLFVHFC
jgi:hypothetical protein